MFSYCFSWSRYYSGYEGLLWKAVFYVVYLLGHPLINRAFSCCTILRFSFHLFSGPYGLFWYIDL